MFIESQIFKASEIGSGMAFMGSVLRTDGTVIYESFIFNTEALKHSSGAASQDIHKAATKMNPDYRSRHDSELYRMPCQMTQMTTSGVSPAPGCELKPS
jgi:hypothetical protein